MLLLAPDLLLEKPGQGDGYYYIAYAFFELNQPEKAKQYLAQATAAADKLLAARIEKLTGLMEGQQQEQQTLSVAERLEAEGKTAEAAAAWEKAWKADKNNLEFALNAVSGYISLQQYPAALLILRDPLVSKDPEAVKLAARLNQTGQMKTLNGYNEAMRSGDAALNRQSYTSALQSYEKALRFKPSNPEALRQIAITKDEQAYDKARETATIVSLQEYRQRYARGRHIEAVDRQLQALLLAGGRAARGSSVSGAETFYQQYLDLYPQGPDAAVARQELCAVYIAEAKSNEKSKYGVGTSVDMYRKAQALCQHPLASASRIKRLERKKRNWNRPEQTAFGWNADRENLLGGSMHFLMPRALGYYAAYRFSTYGESLADWKTDDLSTVPSASRGKLTFTGNTVKGANIITLGLTKKVFYPVWVYAGAGLAFQEEIKEFRDAAGNEEHALNEDRSYTALNPEAGLLLVVGPVFLRGGFSKPLSPKAPGGMVTTFGAGIVFGD
ncbi:hypothetical protein LJY25_03695 [Hymenobacter sp. BT175]|uniref:hypothetical protein n=1 Tax=Hymenobacter translucens TaxID=2886507 RepID=UPI001D0F00EB|nr:hypothetical protein [Hymenobacter translucens]MCC2545535.1 hypothetical protein [Hymenobacter translucens]